MKTKILALAGILLAVAAFTFVFPVTTARATMETSACPSTICVIMSAYRDQQGPEMLHMVSCNPDESSCEACCLFCSNYDATVGKFQMCGCDEGGYSMCPR